MNGGVNTYLYAQANSLKYIDVNGLFAVALAQGGRVLLGGLIGAAAVDGIQGTQDALENSSSSSRMVDGGTSDTELGGSDSANDGASDERIICAMECDIAALQGMEDCINDDGVCEDDDMFQQCLDFVDRRYTNCVLRCQRM